MPDPSASARSATDGDVPAVTACLASAFFEDPLWGPWTFPDRASRAQLLYRLMESWVAAGVRHPWVLMTPGAQAAMLWIPPGVPEMTAAEEADFERLLVELFGPRARELAGVMEAFEENHPRETAHYYLSLWGTHRDHLGRGLGAALMDEALARIDAEHMPAYLESTNPVNLSRYEALGFRPRGEFSRAGSPLITTMWREPR